jgi:putative hydrolase of the HAD superfamily
LSVAAQQEAIVPQAILFDLDETLIDRTRSIVNYAERFQRDFTDHMAQTTVSTIATAILTADERGYRPREELFEELLQRLPWQTPPEVLCLHTHWETWFPASSVARPGLKETLTALQAQGIRLGVVTNGPRTSLHPHGRLARSPKCWRWCSRRTACCVPVLRTASCVPA